MVQLEIDHEDGRISAGERANMEDDLLERLAVSRQRDLEEQQLLEAEAWEEEELEGGERPTSEEGFDHG